MVSCVGAFGSHEAMRRVCGETNVAVMRAAKSRGVGRFAFISAHDFGPPVRQLLRGYFEGKYMAEDELFRLYENGTGVSLRPGMIYGTRHVPLGDAAHVPLPLSLVGMPLRKILANQQVRMSILFSWFEARARSRSLTFFSFSFHPSRGSSPVAWLLLR